MASYGEEIPAGMTRLISLTLRVGVGLSAALALVGLGLLLAGPQAAFTAATIQGTPFSITGFASGLVQARALDVLLLAFLVLIATPLVRVIISVALFANVRDRQFTVLTLTVLLLLAASVLIGALT
jgi:uncharacterized membrane protein